MSSMAIFRSPSEMSNPIIGCERCGKNHAVDYPCEFIARIERERNEACEELKRHQDKHAKEINDADAELEKARQDAEHWSNQYHQEHWRANEALKSLSIKQQTVTIAEQTISDQFKRIQRLESERDEARKEIARLQMELDWSCSAEELRQARQELDRLRAALVEAEKDAETLQASNNTYERDWPQLVHERSRWRECAERLAGQMQRLADCDWVITLPDRMDAVRDVARNALAEFDRLKEGSK